MPNEMPPPWRPTSEAPRDGTDLLVVYDDFGGVAVIFWGELGEPPYTEGWVRYYEDIGDFEHTEWEGEDYLSHFVGWVPYLKQFEK
jgi:hypothetical protein